MEQIKNQQIENNCKTPFDSNGFCSDEKIDNEYVVLPGFCDVHVHFREPGFSYKESIGNGSYTAMLGGYTTVCTMPNLNPVPDNMANLYTQLEIIQNDSVIQVIPYGAITKGQNGKKLAKLKEIAPYVVAFSDDGKGVQSDKMMKKAMKIAKRLNKIIVAHCEDNSLLNGGYIHLGEYAKLNGHKGISSESEWKQVERDIQLVRQTGVSYHVCHISTKESVELIRKAKKEGLDITCETAPHYLIFNDMDLKDSGNFKMNPPIRSEQDRLALIQGVVDGTIDMIATDHAPHSLEEKSKGLKGSLNGIVGLETAFPILYTHLVKNNIITLEKLVELMCVNPRKRFNLGNNGYTLWNLEKSYKITANELRSKGKSTPFDGMEVYGELHMVVIEDKVVYKKEN